MLNNFEEILCFAAVCKTGSITQAAALLKCSKANISRKITALEKRMETKLLQRSTRRIYLTEAGTRFKQQAIQIYNDTRQFDNRTRDEESKLAGRFTITAPVSLSAFIIAPLLFDLQNAFPEIEFELIPTNENIKLIESEVELAIRTHRVVDDTLVARKLGEFHEGFFVSSKNVHRYSSLNLDTITARRIVLNEERCLNVFDRVKMLCLDFPNSIRVREFQIAVNLLFRHDTIAWLPNYCEGVTRDGDTITRILPDIKGQPWPVYFVFPFQTPIPVKLKSVIDFLESRLSNKK